MDSLISNSDSYFVIIKKCDLFDKPLSLADSSVFLLDGLRERGDTVDSDYWEKWVFSEVGMSLSSLFSSLFVFAIFNFLEMCILSV